MAEVSLALDCKTNLGESPTWDGNAGVLYFIDINGKRMHAWRPADGKHTSAQQEKMVGTVVPAAKGGVVAAFEDTVEALDFSIDSPSGNSSNTVIASLPTRPVADGRFRFNDGKCDPEGRLWAGVMNLSWRSPTEAKGKFYRLDPAEKDANGSYQLNEVLSEVNLSNGMTWTADGRQMYYIDSATQAVDVFDFDAEAGKLSNRKTVVRIPESDGLPDGMTIDASGNLWVALGESGAVFQYDPSTGQQVMRVPIPVKRLTACTFGGENLGELYVTTREEKRDDGKPFGALWSVRVPGVRGLHAAYSFAG